MNRYIFIVLLTLVSISVKAEYCWMVGCRGAVAYVYMPWSQVDNALTESYSTFNVDVKHNRFDLSKRLLARPGLPDVGETVTLNITSYLLFQTQLSEEAVRNEIRKNWFQLDKQKKEVSLYTYDFSSLGAVMRQGAQFKIIGYIGDANPGVSSLFALVQVQSD